MIALLLALAAFAGPTLAELEDRAVARAPSVQELMAAEEAATGRVLGARAIENPELRFELDPLLAQGGPVPATRLRLRFDRPGERAARVDGAQAQAQAARIASEAEADAVRRAVRLLVGRLPLCAERAALARERADALARVAALREGDREDGLATVFQTVDALAQASDAALEADRAEVTRAGLEAALRALLGWEEPELVLPALDPPSGPPPPLAEATERAAEHPEVLASAAAIALADAAHRQAVAGAIPWFRFVQVGATWAPGGPSPDVGVGVDLPLFAWNTGAIRAARAGRDEAASAVDRTRAARQAAARAASVEADVAWSAWQRSLELRTLAEASLPRNSREDAVVAEHLRYALRELEAREAWWVASLTLQDAMGTR